MEDEDIDLKDGFLSINEGKGGKAGGGFPE